jgi:hypothetical protein
MRGAWDPERAIAGLKRGDFDALAPCFVPDPDRDEALPLIVVWHREGSLGDEPAVVAEALTCAAFLGAMEAAVYFLERGVDPTLGTGCGMDALHWAVNRGQLNTTVLLLRWQAPLEVLNVHGTTVLGTAIWSAIHEPKPAHLRIIELLMDAGASPSGVKLPTGHRGVDAILRRRGVL